MKLNNLVRAAIFAALAIGVGFSLLLIPNIELITVTIFISGLTLGSAWGMLIGGTAEIIFSSLNPLGSGLSFPPLFFSQVLSMIIIGAIGGWLRPIFYRPVFSFKTVNATITSPFISSGIPHTAASAISLCETRLLSISAVPIRCPATFRMSSARPRSQK